jgi:type IV secretion system protein VirB9
MTRSILIVSSLALMGCETAYPDIALDAAPMRPAMVVSFDDGKPVREIIETATPFPLPGQLKPIEENDAPSPELKPFEQIDAANSLAKIEPDLARFVNAVQVYPFMEGALYRLYAAPEQVTDIALEPGERLNSVSAGDTVRWVVGDTSSGGAGGSGAAAGERVHILVKPIAPGLSTNLVIATDRRAYHLEMRSFRETYMAAISWTYPQDQLVKRREEAARAKAAGDSVVAPAINPDHLKFRYEIEGDRPHWRPVRAFDDGEQVFIQFPETIAQGEAPPLFVLSRDGKPELVNYRMRGNYYVVDRLFSAAELRLGEKRQSVVRILRTDLKGRI